MGQFLRVFTAFFPAGWEEGPWEGVRGEGKPSLLKGSERTSTEGSTDLNLCFARVLEGSSAPFGTHSGFWVRQFVTFC